MNILSVTDASRMAGVPRATILNQIQSGELRPTPDGISISELIRVYPSLKPLGNLKLREVKKAAHVRRAPERFPMLSRTIIDVALDETADGVDSGVVSGKAFDQGLSATSAVKESEAKPVKTMDQTDAVQLLYRELEWNKKLLEQTNKQMATQLAEQRAMIADQARRLDEKDRFWGRQVEIAQSLLAAPEPKKRKKLFGLF